MTDLGNKEFNLKYYVNSCLLMMEKFYHKKIQYKNPTDKVMATKITFASIFLILSFGLILFLSVISQNNFSFGQPASNATTTNLSTTGTSATTTNVSPKLQFLGTENGQITSTRVLEVQPFPKVEISFKENSVFNGINITSIGTFWAIMKPDGTFYGDGKGIDTANNGEMATWTTQGIGNVTSDNKIRLQGSVFHNANPQGELKFLNNKVGYIQVEINSQGKSSSKFWLIQ